MFGNTVGHWEEFIDTIYVWIEKEILHCQMSMFLKVLWSNISEALGAQHLDRYPYMNLFSTSKEIGKIPKYL